MKILFYNTGNCYMAIIGPYSGMKIENYSLFTKERIWDLTPLAILGDSGWAIKKGLMEGRIFSHIEIIK